MPVIHIFAPEGFVSPARKRLMIENVTKAAVDFEHQLPDDPAAA